MPKPLYAKNLRQAFAVDGLTLADGVDALRDQQLEALQWAAENEEYPYLLVNAPTGSGKTLLLATYGASFHKQSWTYTVHTIALQNQVAGTFTNLPVLTGRRNHPCLIGRETHGMPITADQAICAAGQWCEYKGRGLPKDPDEVMEAAYARHSAAVRDGSEPMRCDYYEQRSQALSKSHRVTNYAMFLSDGSLVRDNTTTTLLADEAHNIEDAVCNKAEFQLFAPSYRRFGIDLPGCATLVEWAEWARNVRGKLPPVRGGREKPDFGLITVREQVNTLAEFTEFDEPDWIFYPNDKGVMFQPVWGRTFVRPQLLRHFEDFYEEDGVQRAMLTSATLMGGDYVADLLGLPEGSWAYLDLPSTFPPENRPVNYAPVVRMNKDRMATAEGRLPMQQALDKMIGLYLSAGKTSGIIHAVSNRYRDNILTESRFRGILTSDRETHKAAVERGEASFVVAANMSEGWDGVDDLCRVVLMPKVPHPNLGDPRIRARMDQDPRSYDYKTLVAVVQGAGRGVRHKTDTADTWILDESWGRLYAKRKEWLPKSFVDAYRHRVPLPYE